MAAPEAGTPIGPPLAVATGVPVVWGVGAVVVVAVGAAVVTGLVVAAGVACAADAAGVGGEKVQFGPWAVAQPVNPTLTMMAATKLINLDRSTEAPPGQS